MAKVVTYRGATPAGGISQELQVEDENGKRYLFRQDEPQEVPDSVAKLAEGVDHQRVEVEPAQKSAKADDGGS